MKQGALSTGRKHDKRNLRKGNCKKKKGKYKKCGEKPFEGKVSEEFIEISTTRGEGRDDLPVLGEGAKTGGSESPAEFGGHQIIGEGAIGGNARPQAR